MGCRRFHSADVDTELSQTAVAIEAESDERSEAVKNHHMQTIERESLEKEADGDGTAAGDPPSMTVRQKYKIRELSERGPQKPKRGLLL